MKAPEDDHGKLELYSLPDREPVEVAQYRCDVVKLSGAGRNARRFVPYERAAYGRNNITRKQRCNKTRAET